MPSVAFYTLGCKVNSYDTEAIWQLFQSAGYAQVDFEHQADVYVINTCTVTNTGDKKSRQMIRRAVRRNPDAVICVTGCYAQTSPAEVAAIEGVDLVIGTQDRGKLLEYVQQIQRTRQPVNAVTNIRKTREFEELDVPAFSDRTRAFLKIQEGCDNFCTFCIIPWSRGRLRSREPEQVLRQAQMLVGSGYREIVLTGIHTGGYGEDLENYNFAKLLRKLSKVDGLQRIRISSIEASQITDEVMDILNQSDVFCRHLHVPLQAGEDEVLSRMKRKYTTAEFADKLKKLQLAMPELAVTTDVITGFPGETEQQFVQGMSYIEEMGFSELHVFPYSIRTGTPAAKMEYQVSEETKQERVQALIELSEQLQLRYAQQFIGKILEVIPERQAKGDKSGKWLSGYSDNYLPVQFAGTSDLIGTVQTVHLDRVTANACMGTLYALQAVSGEGGVR